MFGFITSLPLALAALIIMSILISIASDKLGDVLHALGLKLNVPGSVRGATFDAVSSSFPEFITAMVAVLLYNEFANVGVATIAGSAIFNILLIPMFAIFFFKGNINANLDTKYVKRDAAFYLVAIGALIAFTLYGSYTPITGLILIGIYAAYVYCLYRQYKKAKVAGYNESEHEEDDIDYKHISYGSIGFWIAAMTGVIWIAIDGLIQSSMVVATTLNIPIYITSVIIVAACTSIPDTILSVNSAKKGDADGAISNAVGSNTFDICICLGLPMLIAGKTITAHPGDAIGVLGFVVMSALLTTGLLVKKQGIFKRDAYIMLGVYALFAMYITTKAIGIVSF